MLGRLFGRGKNDNDEATCAACGRTLLAGEWTQRLEDEDGNEQVLCSLCGEVHSDAAGQRHAAGTGAGGAVRPSAAADAADAPPERDERGGENAALWKAIKDRDAQIERLEEQLARSEAERQELAGLLARARAQGEAGGAEAGRPGASVPPGPPTLLDDTGELPAVELPGGEETGPVEIEPETAAATAVDADTGTQARMAEAPAEGTAESAETTAEIELSAAEAQAEASSLTLLQRGVDLLNVSPVPRKVADTNADLGIPSVHVGFLADAVAVTFMWTMGWYQFTVAVDSGAVRLADRGYDERADLQPNATVRADGTVQLAAARISRAAAQRDEAAAQRDEVAPRDGTTARPDEAAAHRDEAQRDERRSAEQPAPEASSAAHDPATAQTEPTPPAGAPEILSKSLLGQRTDDEQQSWEKTRARDFDWDH